MMRALIFTVLGYWLSRQVYEKYDLRKQEAAKTAFKKRLTTYLQSKGFTETEVSEAQKIICKENEQ